MSWYRTGTVTVTNGSKTVTGVGTLWTSAVNAGDAFALVDANGNPTGAWYEVEAVTSNTALVLKQSYAGSTGSNKQYCVFNLVGNMTTPSFAQRLATFFASFQSLIDKPTTTPTASSIPIADANGDIDSGWIKDATASAKGVVELATSAETTTATDTTRAVTPAGFLAGLRGNLLGTVSRAGGVPTGAVIERGSNANGEYVRFADGTQICVVRFTDFPSIQAGGTVPATTYKTWTFPAGFSDANSIAVSEVLEVSNTHGFASFAISSISTGSVVLRLGILNTTQAAELPGRAMAIGRWF